MLCSLATIDLNVFQNSGSRYYFIYDTSCTDDIPQADLVKTLLKDVWDIRTAKLRKSIDQMVAKQERHAQVRNITVSFLANNKCTNDNI